MKKERKESLIRIPIGIIFAVVAELWGTLMLFILLLNFLITLFTNKRNKQLCDFSNLFINYIYSNSRYLFFTTNERPWPFNEFKHMEKCNYKFQN